MLHTEARAAEKLRAFRDSRERWIVAVNMVSEGVDIPRLRVGVYATAAKTPLIFRQIVGRFVRTIPGRPAEPATCSCPPTGCFASMAADVEEELRHVLRPPAEAAPDAFDELPERRRTEVGEDARVRPAGRRCRAPAGAVRTAAGAGADRARHVRRPARGRRRARRRPGLRAPRAPARQAPRPRLQLRGLDGRSHREINAWLNRETGVTRVDDASLPQLERSITLLLSELDRLSRRRRAS